MRNNAYLATEPIGKLLFKLAVPTLTAQLINLLYNVVDKIYIGHMAGVGNLALAGLGLCTPLIMIISAFASLVASGGAPRASIAMGAGNREGAEKILGNCVLFLMLLSVLLTAVMQIWSRQLLMLFGGSLNTIDYAVNYMKIYSLGTLFVQLTLGMNAFITAQGFTKESMLTVLIGAALNIILDPIFIFGFHMGVRGAALATILSQFVSCIRVICFLRSEKSLLALKKENLSLELKLILPCLALGLSPFIMQSSESLLFICFNSSLQKYGGDIAVSTMTVLSSASMMSFMPISGFTQGAQPLISYNYGALKPDRVKGVFLLLVKICFSFAFIMWGAIMLFPREIVSIFTAETLLVQYAARALRMYSAVACLMGIQMACQMTLVSLGNAKASIVIAVVRKFILLIPLIYLMPHLVSDKAAGIFLAEPVADFLAVCFTISVFIPQLKKAVVEMERKITE